MFQGILIQILASVCLLVSGKVLINSLDSLESNLISPHVAPPAPPPAIRDSDWVKISQAPPLVVNTRLGDRVEIECEALGSPSPHIQWLRGDRIVSQSRKTQSSRGLSEKLGLAKTKSRLVIDCVTRKHEGFYSCTAFSGGKTVKSLPTLILIESNGQGDLDVCSTGVQSRQPPRILSWAPTTMETMGGDILLPCHASGTPSPTIYWIDPHNNVRNSVRHTVADNGDLTISELAWSDMGEYTCVAESAEGRDQVTTFVYPVMGQH